MSPTHQTIKVRIPTDLRDRLRAAAEERELSQNLIVCAAIDQLLDDLAPADVIRRRIAYPPNS